MGNEKIFRYSLYLEQLTDDSVTILTSICNTKSLDLTLEQTNNYIRDILQKFKDFMETL